MIECLYYERIFNVLLWFSAERLSDFIVGLANVSRDILKPVIGNYTVCGHGPTIANNDTKGQIYNVTCNPDQPPARYVIIQLPKKSFLVFCEVEVYGEGKM